MDTDEAKSARNYSAPGDRSLSWQPITRHPPPKPPSALRPIPGGNRCDSVCSPWPGCSRCGDYFAFTESGTQYRLDENRGGGVAAGLNAEYRITGPLNAVAGVAYSASNEDEINVTQVGGTTENTVRYSSDGAEMWLIKAGFQYRLPDPVPDNRRFHPAAYITVAPALIVMDHPDIAGLDNEDVTGTSRNFGLNLGVDAVSNLGTRGLALSFALEDFVTFWNEDDRVLRDQVLLGGLFEEPVTINYDASVANVLLLRAGLSWRF
jgi:hypothetical protein